MLALMNYHSRNPTDRKKKLFFARYEVKELFTIISKLKKQVILL
jgi:hypothetical protein